ncbi:MAG: 2-C-methyl-D-erythritol 4-phosphate cytidylyltransferase [Actinomycetia bacterium]|nr:2-C-methyl-D-erythritol 4-phosphate cytidylyltransferase [Actinomycetes bacterium]
MSVACIIPAAGRGERLGGATPKALRQISGKTLLEHSVRAMIAAREVTSVVIAAPQESVSQVEDILSQIAADVPISVVVGGQSRTDSVRNAARAIPSAEIVLVHDAARPFVPAEVVSRVISAVRAGAPAVVPAIPVTDTIKHVDAAGRVVHTVERDELRAAQTPQGFTKTALDQALADHQTQATDEAGLLEELGVPVLVVAGHSESMKVTRPLDLVVAEAILRRRQSDRMM